MSIVAYGLNHRTASVELRERIAFPEENLSDMLSRLTHDLSNIREAAIVSTCNRTELYCSLSDDNTHDISQWLSATRPVDITELEDSSYKHWDKDAAKHMIRVAAGLDSQMVGETEILGQLKQAYATAREAHCTGKVLNRLFEKSFQAAKVTRTQTGITRGKISIGNVTVDLASRIFGKLGNSRVLLLGSGEVGEKTAQALKSRGIGDISVSSRTFENAYTLANNLGVAAIDFESFVNQLEHFDIVICSTAAPDALISKEVMTRAMNQRPERPCFLIDLAMPRDVDPSVEEVENVYLYNLDDLSNIANENLEARKAEIEKAREILKKHAWNLWLQLRRRELMLKA